ncbi:MAG: hypothetical protein KatS3mg131_0814 [Candidatus Tectimicrobiota bacterium]|nr:MAG: hypothetical protein KatS3mg131_0814 [Candidatus Tectomicrobia bacterium]
MQRILLAHFFKLPGNHFGLRLRLLKLQAIPRIVDFEQHITRLHRAAFVDVEDFHDTGDFRGYGDHAAFDAGVVGDHVLHAVKPVANAVTEPHYGADPQYHRGQPHPQLATEEGFLGHTRFAHTAVFQ